MLGTLGKWREVERKREQGQGIFTQGYTEQTAKSATSRGRFWEQVLGTENDRAQGFRDAFRCVGGQGITGEGFIGFTN